MEQKRQKAIKVIIKLSLSRGHVPNCGTMNEGEDYVSQNHREQQDALNAALEIAAAAAAAAQQDEELAEVETNRMNGIQGSVMNDENRIIEQETEPQYVIETLQPRYEVQAGENIIHPDLETGQSENMADSQNQDIFQANDATGTQEGHLDAMRPADGAEQSAENGLPEADPEADIDQTETNIEEYQNASEKVTDIDGLNSSEQNHVNEEEAAHHFEQNEGDGVAASSRSAIQHQQNNRALTHHSKRRKINTCLPCKRRKVKCDREKPYCGQCKKSQIPEGECTWSAPVDHNSSGASTLTAFPLAADTSSTNGNSSQWQLQPSEALSWNGNIPLTGQTPESLQVLLEPIMSLESALANARSRKQESENAEEWSDEKASLGQGDARGIAADALAMIARQNRNEDISVVNRHSKAGYKKLFAQSSLTWPSMTSLSSRVRDDLTLLPDVKGLFGALQTLDVVQQHGVLLGIPVALVEVQMAFLITQADLSADQFPTIDLSLVALLFYLLATSVDLMSSEQASMLELVENEEGIQGVIEIWIETADHILQELQYDSRPNLNIIVTLLLKRQFQASRGNVNAASVALSSCILLSRSMGIDMIGSQKDDVSAWESSLDQKRQTDHWQTVIDQAQYMSPFLCEDPGQDFQLVAKWPWLSPRNVLVRESARQIYTYLALQDWTADSLSPMSISPSEQISLPLSLAPNTVTEDYKLTGKLDETKPSVMLLLRYCFNLSHRLACWKHDGGVSDTRAYSNSTDTERALLNETRPAFLKPDHIVDEDEDLSRVQHLRLVAELMLQFCLFTVRKTDSNLAEQSIDAAEKILQTRSLLGSDFLAPLHKFFWIQRYTLEAAVMIVIYLHQYSAHLGEERRQALQALIDDAYAQPGFENAHSLLSLSFDVQSPLIDEQQKVDDEIPVSNDLSHDNTSTVLGGMMLSNGKRLASSHPIVVGLRMFVNGQSLPYGSNQETLDFWDAMQRYCQFFLIG